MVKRTIILFTFLAYSLTLVHSLVPHHHHEDKSHAENHHHHHGHDEDDHHEHEKKDLSHFFSDVIHHPSAEQVVIHSSQSESVQKVKALDNFIALVFDKILLLDFKPPDRNFSYHKVHYPLDLIGNSHLRAPPAI
jgi:Ca2+/H+ antiporter